MLDSDLAALYGVPTGMLNQAVHRRLSRFPLDFAFTITREEADSLRSQIVISKSGRGGRRYLPRVFTEHGVAMLSSVLNSERAVRVNIEIVRAFVRLRRVLALNADLAARLEKVEAQLKAHGTTLGEHAADIRAVFDDIRRLMEEPPAEERPPIGFAPS